MSSETSVKNNLEKLMKEALNDSPEAARSFFEEFLKTELLVPERFQDAAFKDSALYLTPFCNILGLKDSDRSVAVAFTTTDSLINWSGRQLNHKRMKGVDLLRAVPKDWWLCINPGQEVEKEMSPWEINQLIGGKDGIEAVIDDLFGMGPLQTLNLRPLKDGEEGNVLSAVKDWAATNRKVEKIYAAKEEAEDENGHKTFTLLLGAQVNTNERTELEQVRKDLAAIAGRHLIGSLLNFKVFADKNEGGLELGIFRSSLPCYFVTPPGIMGKLKRLLEQCVQRIGTVSY